MNPTDPTPLPCPFCGKQPRIQTWLEDDGSIHLTCCEHAQGKVFDGREEAVNWWNTRAPSAELTQAQAEAAAMREWVRESVVVSMEFADGRVLTKADLLATKHFLPTTTENTKPQ